MATFTRRKNLCRCRSQSRCKKFHPRSRALAHFKIPSIAGTLAGAIAEKNIEVPHSRPTNEFLQEALRTFILLIGRWNPYRSHLKRPRRLQRLIRLKNPPMTHRTFSQDPWQEPPHNLCTFLLPSSGTLSIAVAGAISDSYIRPAARIFEGADAAAVARTVANSYV